MEVAVCSTCPCNGKTYVHLTAHRRTKTHRLWELQGEVRELTIRIKQLENENQRIRVKGEPSKVSVRKSHLGERIQHFLAIYETPR